MFDETSQELLYIGEASSLRERLCHHKQRDWGKCRPAFPWRADPQLDEKYRRRELESDLLGAFYWSAGRPPKAQYAEVLTF